MMDEVLMHMGIRKAARRDYCEMNVLQFLAVKGKNRENILNLKEGKAIRRN